jgi:hypothetical protein
MKKPTALQAARAAALRLRRSALYASAVSIVFAWQPSLAQPSLAQPVISEPLTIATREIDTFLPGAIDNQFGALTFLGGLRLTSSHRDFEGLSGLTMRGETMLLVSDEANWLQMRLQSDSSGKPIGIADAVIGPLLDTSGQPLGSKRLADAEAITQLGQEVWVTSERNQPIRAYTLSNHGLTGPARLPVGDEAPLVERWNLGLEAMIHMTEGPLVGQTLVFLEDPPRSASAPTAARLLNNGEIIPFAVQRQDGFSITGAAMLPGGDVLLVERRFAWSDGIFMRLKVLLAQDIMAGAAQGRILMQADGRTRIDNMEGIAVSDHPNGPIVTLISDDNGNFFQQTVLLRFQLTAGQAGLRALPLATPPTPAARPDAFPAP